MDDNIINDNDMNNNGKNGNDSAMGVNGDPIHGYIKNGWDSTGSNYLTRSELLNAAADIVLDQYKPSLWDLANEHTASMIRQDFTVLASTAIKSHNDSVSKKDRAVNWKTLDQEHPLDTSLLVRIMLMSSRSSQVQGGQVVTEIFSPAIMQFFGSLTHLNFEKSMIFLHRSQHHQLYNVITISFTLHINDHLH